MTQTIETPKVEIKTPTNQNDTTEIEAKLDSKKVKAKKSAEAKKKKKKTSPMGHWRRGIWSHESLLSVIPFDVRDDLLKKLGLETLDEVWFKVEFGSKLTIEYAKKPRLE